MKAASLATQTAVHNAFKAGKESVGIGATMGSAIVSATYCLHPVAIASGFNMLPLVALVGASIGWSLEKASVLLFTSVSSVVLVLCHWTKRYLSRLSPKQPVIVNARARFTLQTTRKREVRTGGRQASSEHRVCRNGLVRDLPRSRNVQSATRNGSRRCFRRGATSRTKLSSRKAERRSPQRVG